MFVEFNWVNLPWNVGNTTNPLNLCFLICKLGAITAALFLPLRVLWGSYTGSHVGRSSVMYIACACGARGGVDGDSSQQVLSPGATAFSSLSLSFLICSSARCTRVLRIKGGFIQCEPATGRMGCFPFTKQGKVTCLAWMEELALSRDILSLLFWAGEEQRVKQKARQGKNPSVCGPSIPKQRCVCVCVCTYKHIQQKLGKFWAIKKFTPAREILVGTLWPDRRSPEDFWCQNCPKAQHWSVLVCLSWKRRLCPRAQKGQATAATWHTPSFLTHHCPSGSSWYLLGGTAFHFTFIVKGIRQSSKCFLSVSSFNPQNNPVNLCYYHPRFTEEVTEARKVAELMILTEIPERRVSGCSKHRRNGRSGCWLCQLERG